VSTVGDLPHVPRDERRRRTERAILEAAREQFACSGYERATIRAVARAAGVDPALVMQHFGSKERLFAEAARWTHGPVREPAPGDDVARAALEDMLARFEGDEADRDAAIALVRSCLTHPEAARIMRDEVVCDRVAAVGSAIGGPDAELRAALIGACVIGLAMARHVLGVEPLASADRADVERLLEPALRSLADPHA
jgi:AcrR family transcriptional regulator